MLQKFYVRRLTARIFVRSLARSRDWHEKKNPAIAQLLFCLLGEFDTGLWAEVNLWSHHSVHVRLSDLGSDNLHVGISRILWVGEARKPPGLPKGAGCEKILSCVLLLFGSIPLSVARDCIRVAVTGVAGSPSILLLRIHTRFFHGRLQGAPADNAQGSLVLDGWRSRVLMV